MTDIAITVFAVSVLVYISASRTLGRAHVGAPIVFTAAGALIAAGPGHLAIETLPVRSLVELTLALTLFHDATRVRPRELKAVIGPCARLLLLGLPLTVLSGFAVGRLLFPEATVWLVLFLAAALAPTDAGLGAATVLNPVVPIRIRSLLNVESGLNDGLAAPVVLFALASATLTGSHEGGVVREAVRELAIGVTLGVAVGVAAFWVLDRARRAGSSDDEIRPLATMTIPLLAYFGCVAVHGNGFVAAFVSGLAYTALLAREVRPDAGGWASGPAGRDQLILVDEVATFLGYAVWALVGYVAVSQARNLFTWQGLGFALLSLTLLRVVPVAVALLGGGLRPQTWLFVGWFGPRGLASVVFALLAVESIGLDNEADPVVGAVVMTVLLSVVLHGVTAGPWARRYGQWATGAQPTVEMGLGPASARPRESTGGERAHDG